MHGEGKIEFGGNMNNPAFSNVRTLEYLNVFYCPARRQVDFPALDFFPFLRRDIGNMNRQRECRRRRKIKRIKLSGGIRSRLISINRISCALPFFIQTMRSRPSSCSKCERANCRTISAECVLVIVSITTSFVYLPQNIGGFALTVKLLFSRQAAYHCFPSL